MHNRPKQKRCSVFRRCATPQDYVKRFDHFSFLVHTSSSMALPPITEPCSCAIAADASSAVFMTTQLTPSLFFPRGATHFTTPTVLNSSFRSFHEALSSGKFPTQTFFSASYLLILGPRLPLPLPLPLPSSAFKTPMMPPLPPLLQPMLTDDVSGRKQPQKRYT